MEELSEQFLHVVILRSLFKSQFPAGFHIKSKSFWVAPAEFFDASVDLIVFYLSVLVFLIFCFKALPRELTL
jgi:hypothetical protein